MVNLNPVKIKLLIFRVIASALLITLTIVAVRRYNSDHLLARSDFGRKTVSDYGLLLEKAARFNDQAAIRYSDFLATTNKADQALVVLHSSSSGTNSWQGWERQGTLLERIGYSDIGTSEALIMALQNFDRILKVYPTYETGIKRNALLALKIGDWIKAYRMADALDKFHAGNGNSDFIRAKAAEGEGDIDKELALLQQVASISAPKSDALYTTESIRNQISILISNSQR